MAKSKRYIYMDLLTCLSALFVVMLHTTLTVYNFRVDRAWFISLAAQTLFIWPVPIFLMIFGANLIKYRERYSTRVFFWKRFKRVGIPFLVWSFIWLVYDCLMGKLPPLSIKMIIKAFLFNQIQNIFWFFYVIIALYICTPILSAVCKKENKNTVLYFMALCIIQCGIIPALATLVHKPVPFFMTYTLTFSYLVYYLAGWYFTVFPLNRRQRIFCYYSALASAVLIYFGTYFLSLHHGHTFNRVLYFYNSPLVFILALAVFSFFQHVEWERILNSSLVKCLPVLASASFGVYIIHLFFINTIHVYHLLEETSLFYMIVLPFMIYALCVIIILVLKKIPGIRHLMP